MATLYFFISKLAGGILDQVKVEATMTAGDICDEIYERKRIVFDDHKLAKGELELYAASNLSRKPIDTLPQRVDATTLRDALRLRLWDKFGEIFTDGLDQNLVHIVVVPQPIVPSGSRHPLLRKRKYSHLFI